MDLHWANADAESFGACSKFSICRIGIGHTDTRCATLWCLVPLAKADLLLIGCIAVNAVLLHYFFKLNKENVGRGIISATFIWAFAFFFYKINQ
jgi:hypothetical protein